MPNLFSHSTDALNNNPVTASHLAILGKPHDPLLQQLLRITKHRTTFHLFVSQHQDLTDLIAQLACQTEPTLQQLSGQFEDIWLSNCNGCHCIIAKDGLLKIHLYLGHLAHNLKAICCGEQAIEQWILTDKLTINELTEASLWQMARLSTPEALLLLPKQIDLLSLSERFLTQITRCGFTLHRLNQAVEIELEPLQSIDAISKELALKERNALKQRYRNQLSDNPLATAQSGSIAIIGGGVAGACLALSLAERGQQMHFFCMDNAAGEQASGNKQGAIYPLLTPEHGALSHYFLQGYLFSRQRILSLVKEGFEINHDFCGVLQTGFDQRSHARLEKIITAQPWADTIAQAISAEQANQIAGISIDQAGIYYPLGGWVCPQQLSRAALEKAAQLADVELHYQTTITAIERRQNKWYLTAKQKDKQQEQQLEFGPFDNLVLANGRHLTDFQQTQKLPISGFRGQVSHIPSRGELQKLNTVLCAHGYLTPAHEQLHCTGASYVKQPDNLDYSYDEQLENLHKIRSSYQADWAQSEIDISGHSARVGVRMVTRDHAPMMGCAPDFQTLFEDYQKQFSEKVQNRSQNNSQKIAQQEFWQNYLAPIHNGLFILGGLGSRGLTSGPLAAELLAAQLCGEIIPTTTDILRLLNPNRMWMRKLIKGKAPF